MLEPRQILDTIVQSSTIELFQAGGLVVAPRPCRHGEGEAIPYHRLTSMIAFRAKRFTGVLTIGVPDAVFALVPQDPDRPFSGRDWVGEMCNQLLGRLKRRLARLGTVLNANLPGFITRAALERLHTRSRPLFGIYEFRTIRGDVVVSLGGGDIDPKAFVYEGSHPVATEGDIILL